MYPDWLSGPVPSGSRPYSQTGELRVSQRAEAQLEMTVLTEQLLDLPDRLHQAGLGRKSMVQLQDAMEAFTELATLAWQGMAEDRFDDVIAQPLYRQRAVAASKRVNRLQQAVTSQDEMSLPSVGTTLPVKTHFEPQGVELFWHSRIRRYTEGLALLRAALQTGKHGLPDSATLGKAVETLRLAAGYGGMHPILLASMRVVTFLALVVGGISTATLIAAATSAFTLQQTTLGMRFAVVAVALIFMYGAGMLMLGVNRQVFVDYMGVTRWRLYEREHATILGVLTGWNWFAALVALFGSVGLIGGAGWLLAQVTHQGRDFLGAPDLQHGLGLLTGPVLAIPIGLMGVLLALPVLVALPATLLYQVLLARDLGTNLARLPVPRRVALRPALRLLMWHLMLAVPLTLGITSQFPMLHKSLLTVHGVALTGQALVLTGMIVVLYVVAVAWPLRMGIAGWQRNKGNDLQRRMDIVADKITHMMPLSETLEEFSPMQAEMQWMIFFRGQLADLRQVRRTVASFTAHALALGIILVVAVLADNGLRWVAGLLLVGG